MFHEGCLHNVPVLQTLATGNGESEYWEDHSNRFPDREQSRTEATTENSAAEVAKNTKENS